jgi:hypothetical protein
MKRIILLIVLLFLALVGLASHYMIHPFVGTDYFSGTFFLASIFSFIDAVLVTILFLSKNTALYGYLLNGFIAIFGTVFMVHFNIAGFMANPGSPSQLFLNPILIPIVVTLADFFIGKALYNIYLRRK